MQLTKKNIYDRCAMGLAALIWVFGLLAAGSDSIYMPWLNVAGAIIFLLASIWLGRTLPMLEASNRVVSSSVSVRTKGLATTFVENKIPESIPVMPAGGVRCDFFYMKMVS